jgi:hypothetical protein
LLLLVSLLLALLLPRLHRTIEDIVTVCSHNTINVHRCLGNSNVTERHPLPLSSAFPKVFVWQSSVNFHSKSVKFVTYRTQDHIDNIQSKQNAHRFNKQQIVCDKTILSCCNKRIILLGSVKSYKILPTINSTWENVWCCS